LANEAIAVEPRIDRLLHLADSIVSNDADAFDAVQETCLLAGSQIARPREADRHRRRTRRTPVGRWSDLGL